MYWGLWRTVQGITIGKWTLPTRGDSLPFLLPSASSVSAGTNCPRMPACGRPHLSLSALTCPHLSSRALTCPHLPSPVLPALTCPHLSYLPSPVLTCPHLPSPALTCPICPHLPHLPRSDPAVPICSGVDPPHLLLLIPLCIHLPSGVLTRPNPLELSLARQSSTGQSSLL